MLYMTSIVCINCIKPVLFACAKTLNLIYCFYQISSVKLSKHIKLLSSMNTNHPCLMMRQLNLDKRLDESIKYNSCLKHLKFHYLAFRIIIMLVMISYCYMIRHYCLWYIQYYQHRQYKKTVNDNDYILYIKYR